MVISKERDFFGQTLVFFPHGKPGLYISRSYFFFFENHEFKIQRKTSVPESFFKEDAGWRIATLLKRDSSAGVFL